MGPWAAPLQLRLFPDGFSILNGAGATIADVRWAQIDQITTRKQDLVTFDAIYLGFRRRDTDRWLKVPEDCAGFMDLAEEMRRRFPSIPSGWYLQVMQPAFQTNLTLLYGS
jgi:hypothetical protein